MEEVFSYRCATPVIHRARRGYKYLASALLGLSLIACAPMYKLSPSAASLRDHMTTDKAAAVLERYVKPDHACTLNNEVKPFPTTLDLERPLSVSGSVVTFSLRYGVVVDSHIRGSITAGTGALVLTYKERRGRYAIDLKTINRAIIYVRKEKSPFPIGCDAMDPGYLVALRSKSTDLPIAEFTIHVPTDHDLDSLMAAVTYLSPEIKMLE